MEFPRTFTGSLLPPALERLEACLEGCARRIPLFEERRHPDHRQWTRWLHAGRALPDGARSRAGQLPHAGWLQHLRHRLRRGQRQVRGRVDRRGTAERQHVGARCSAIRRLCRFDVDIRERASLEVYRREYAISYPGEELSRPAALSRRPALRQAARSKGAVFGARFGWERPLWFAKSGPARGRVLVSPRELARAGRRGVPGCELLGGRVSTRRASRSTKSRGPALEEFLDHLCANKLPKEERADGHSPRCAPRRAASSATSR